jgi:dethiobiotin synthetase
MKLFVTSSGTDSGKTYISCGLLERRKADGHKVHALKPLQSGCEDHDPTADIARLLRACGEEVSDTTLRASAPWRFKAPLAPPLAAALEHRVIDFNEVVEFCRQHIAMTQGDLLIEGVGGVMAPLTKAHLNIDLIKALDLPVLLIGGSYLGAMSHTLSVIDNINHRQIRCMGLVINETEGSTVSLTDTYDLIKPFCGPIPIVICPRHSHYNDAVFAQLSKICDQ